MTPDASVPRSSRRHVMTLISACAVLPHPMALLFRPHDAHDKARLMRQAETMMRATVTQEIVMPAAMRPAIAASLSPPALGLRQGWVLLHTDL